MGPGGPIYRGCLHRYDTGVDQVILPSCGEPLLATVSKLGTAHRTNGDEAGTSLDHKHAMILTILHMCVLMCGIHRGGGTGTAGPAAAGPMLRIAKKKI